MRLRFRKQKIGWLVAVGILLLLSRNTPAATHEAPPSGGTPEFPPVIEIPAQGASIQTAGTPVEVEFKVTQKGRGDPTLLFPQLVSGGGTTSQIILTNPSATEDRGRLYFLSDDGRPLTVGIDGEQRQSVDYVVPPAGAFNLSSDSSGPLRSGYAMAISEKPVSRLTGTIVYRISGFEVSVPSSPLGTRFQSFIQEDASASSGLAFVNLAGQPVSLSLELRDQAGAVHLQEVVELPPGAHLARFATQLFPGLEPGFVGSVDVSSETPFSMVGLRQKPSGSLAVLSVGTPESGRPASIFPQIADGGGIRSEVVIMNVGEEATDGIVEFYDPDGIPLLLVIDGVTVDSVPFHLPAGGSARIETDGAGPPKAGYGRVRAANPAAQLVANAIYSLEAFEVSVPPSEEVAEHHISFEFGGGLDTGLAVVNAGDDAIEVSAFLVGSTGRRVAHEVVELPSRSQRARFISQIFGSIGSDLQGTVHLTSRGRFSAIGLRQRSDGSLAALSGSPRSLIAFGAAVKTDPAPEIKLVAVSDDGGKLFGFNGGSGGSLNRIVWLGPGAETLVADRDGSGNLSQAVYGENILLFSSAHGSAGRYDVTLIPPVGAPRIVRDVDLPASVGSPQAPAGTPSTLATDLSLGRQIVTGVACSLRRFASLLQLDESPIACPTELDVKLEELSSVSPELADAGVGFDYLGCGREGRDNCPDSLIAQAEDAVQAALDRINNSTAELADARSRLACADISGSWTAREEGTLACTLSVGGQSESFEDPISAEETVALNQDVCMFSYDPGGFVGGRRTGIISGNRVSVEGLAAIPGENVQTVTANHFMGAGELINSTLSLSGSGVYNGTVLGDGGVTVTFNCTTETEAELDRVCASPTRFARTGSASTPGGFLVMSYEWQSSGRTSDLGNCRIFERVEYPSDLLCGFAAGQPCYRWPKPPWQTYVDNPTIRYLGGSADGLTMSDTHATGVFSPFPVEASFQAVQDYFYECACDGWQPHHLYGPMTITRSVTQREDGEFVYKIVKVEPDGARFQAETEIH